MGASHTDSSARKGFTPATHCLAAWHVLPPWKHVLRRGKDKTFTNMYNPGGKKNAGWPRVPAPPLSRILSCV